MTTTTLYRFYDDRDRLLYVGISGNPARRHHEHSKEKPWWTEVARSTMEHFESRWAALDAERDAIHAEKPLYNIIHNRGAVALQRDQPDEGTAWHVPLAESDRLALSSLHELTKAIDRVIQRGLFMADDFDQFAAVLTEIARYLPYADHCRTCGMEGYWIRYPVAVEVKGPALKAYYECHICERRWTANYAVSAPADLAS